jgi:hypothetical protein
VFDNVGVSNYINNKLKAGGPLVTTSNKNFTSDFNIFNSDKNATVAAMAKSQQAFENACFPVFEKMINTVPKGINLSAPIGPRHWITMESHLDLTSIGAVTYSGKIGTYSKTAVPKNASYSYGTTSGGTIAKTSQGGGGYPIRISNLGYTKSRHSSAIQYHKS